MDFFKNIIKYRVYMIAAAKANLKAEVSGSYLNWVWWILEPLGIMVVYAIIFGWLFNNSISYFPVFIFIGNLIWGYFNTVSSSSVTMIKQNETLVSKVYFPKYVLLIVKMLVEGFKFLISFGLTIVLMVIFRVNFSINMIWILPTLIVLIINTFGFGLILLNFGVYIEDLGYAMRIIMTVWMYFSGIFYDVRTMIPAPFSELLLTFNGPAFFIDAFRNSLLYGMIPNLNKLIAWLVIGVITSIIAILLINRNENDYVKRI